MAYWKIENKDEDGKRTRKEKDRGKNIKEMKKDEAAK